MQNVNAYNSPETQRTMHQEETLTDFGSTDFWNITHKHEGPYTSVGHVQTRSGHVQTQTAKDSEPTFSTAH